MKTLQYVSWTLLSIMFVGVLYIVDLANEGQGVVADANEYLVTHNMTQSLPSFCVKRPSGRYVCRGTATTYLSCSARTFLSSTVDSNRCTQVDIPETR